MNGWIRSRRLSLSAAALMLVLAFVTGSALHGPGPRLRVLVGTGLDAFNDSHNLLSPLTSVFFATSTLELLVSMAALVFLVGASEQLMGWWRTLVAFVVTAYLGAGLGMVLQAAGLLARETWAVRIRESIVFDPFTAITGVVMTASAFAGPLWRRRTRVLGFTAVIVVFLYSGQPSDLFRLIAAAVGLLLGFLLARPSPGARWSRSSHHEARSLLAAALMITAVGPFVSIFSPARYGPLHPLGLLFRDALPHLSSVRHLCLHHMASAGCSLDVALARINGPGPVLLAPLPLIVLIVAGLGMMRGRRSAAWIAIAVNVLLAVLASFYYGFLPAFGSNPIDIDNASGTESAVRLAVSVLVPLIIAVLIAMNVRHFTVRTPRSVVMRFLIRVGAAFVFLSGLYFVVGLLFRHQFRPVATPDALLLDLPERFVPVGFLRLEHLTFVPIGPLSRLVYQWIGPAFWIALLVAVIPVFFSERNRSSSTERERVIAMLRVGGGGTLGWMSTWNGNSYWFAPDGRVAIAYRVYSGVAITTSDPIGPPEALEAAIRDFATFCDDNGWTPVFYSVHEYLAPLFASMGWSSMVVGEETVVRPEAWTMQGKAWQDVRSSINRAARSNLRAEWTSYRALPVTATAQLESISEAWVAEKNLPELGFTLGGLDELRDPAVALLLAIDEDGTIQAVTSWMPSYQDGEVVGWTLDFMRRRPDSMNGVMEFLIASAALRMQQQGIETMSLSAAPLARSQDPGADNGRMQRLLGFLARTLEPVYGFASLLNFKQKFQPEFRPLLMTYPDPLALPAIGFALARAYLPSMSLRQSIRFVRSLG
ncbi:bifunctional lysylphosphatidylglycerol flippase/synthetase MprF [Parafrigoribacterium soli]|uniref:bifunctional lysylphosphatidylglycerol flippase/synthetase MprF n=1 Tax=Parafrigoribacterium soli TaxID=3144663 RepID=UPI0032EB40D1